jgi:hypothetical protein
MNLEYGMMGPALLRSPRSFWLTYTTDFHAFRPTDRTMDRTITRRYFHHKTTVLEYGNDWVFGCFKTKSAGLFGYYDEDTEALADLGICFEASIGSVHPLDYHTSGAILFAFETRRVSSNKYLPENAASLVLGKQAI